MRRFAAVAAAFALVGCTTATYTPDDPRDALRSADTPGLMSMSDDDLMAITDSMTEATYQLATRFGTDFTWDELLAAAVEEIDQRAEDA